MPIFNFHRFISLIRRDWILYKKQLLTIALILMAYCVFLMLVGREHSSALDISPMFIEKTYLPEVVIMNMLCLVGSFVTLLIFKDLRKTEDRLQFLQLPASHFEKFLSKWIYSFPGFWILTALVFFVTYTFFGGIIERYTDSHYPSIMLINFARLKMLLVFYSIGHSVLFLLGIIFNRFVIPKSLVTVVAIFFMTIGIAILIFRLVMFDYFNGWVLRGDNLNFTISFEDNAKWFLSRLHYLALYSIVPFLWFISYLKISEKEL